MISDNNSILNSTFQNKLQARYVYEENEKATGAFSSSRGKISTKPVKLEATIVFDKEKLQNLVEEGNLDKILEYLDKCNKTYYVEQLDSNRSKVKVDNITFTVITKVQGSEETEEKSIEELVAKKIDVWINDFKTGYTRWGLDKAPTEAQIKTFREVLTAQCQDKTSLKDTSDNGVHVWVRAKANYAITQIKFNNYVDNLSNIFAKSFADFGLDSTLTADELKEVKTALETKYYSEVENHVASINAKGAHVIESNADLEKWLKELVNSALESVKAEKEAETPTTTTPPTTTTAIDYESIIDAIGEVSRSLPDSAKGKSFDPTISAYNGDNNVIGDNSVGDTIFKDLSEKVKYETRKLLGKNYIKDTIGEANFDALFKSAWIRTVESMNKVPVNSDEFAKNVLAKLEEIFKNIQAHPENMSLFVDTSVNSKNLPGYDIALHLNCKDFKKYDTGEYHLDDDNSDIGFQKTMQELLNRIYDKYPNVDKSVLKDLFNKAQGEALDAVNGKDTLPFTHQPIGNANSARVDTLVDIVMYKFHNLLAEQVLKDGTLKARTETTPTSNPTPKSSQTDAQNEDYKTGASGVKSTINTDRVKNAVLDGCKQANSNKTTFHTEFGIDSNGNIVFQESSTNNVYKKLKETLKGFASDFSSDALKKLGEANFDKLVQAAWIMTYNDFDSSTSNDLEKFINKVMDNLTKMLDKIASNPELMEAYTKHTSYADSSLTKDLKHYGTNTTYGGDEKISYAGAVTVHDDGTVHISNTDDDNDYQTTMNALLERVIAKYPSVDSKVITSVFRNAQKAAIEALQGNKYDCPYGTGNNNGRVEDTSRNWGGKDNRKGDKSYIHMDQLVQMTLYYFDKLILKELTK